MTLCPIVGCARPIASDRCLCDGCWKVYAEGDGRWLNSEANRRLHCHAVERIEAERAALAEQLAAAYRMAARLEWSGEGARCPECHGYKPDSYFARPALHPARVGHHESCTMAALALLAPRKEAS